MDNGGSAISLFDHEGIAKYSVASVDQEAHLDLEQRESLRKDVLDQEGDGLDERESLRREHGTHDRKSISVRLERRKHEFSFLRMILVRSVDQVTETTLLDAFQDTVQIRIRKVSQFVQKFETSPCVFQDDSRLIGPVLGAGTFGEHLEVPRRCYKQRQDLGEKIRLAADHGELRDMDDDANVVQELDGGSDVFLEHVRDFIEMNDGHLELVTDQLDSLKHFSGSEDDVLEGFWIGLFDVGESCDHLVSQR